jgi:hypothetical protein
MYYNSSGNNPDSVKLSGCSDFYSNNPTNQAMCSCGALVNVGTSSLSDAQCTTLAECNKPYCIGRCASIQQRCTGFPNEYNLQCTSGGATQKGGVYYAFQLYTPMSILGNVLNTIANLPKDIGGWLGDTGKTILIWAGIIIGSLIVLSVIYRVIMNSLLKSKST